MSKIRRVLDTIGVGPDIFGMFEQGYTLAQYKKVSKNSLEIIFSMACEKLQANSMSKAEDYLFYLCIQDHLDLRYLNALGVCYLRQKKLEEGLRVFQAVNLVEKTPQSLLNFAFCAHGLGMKGECQESLEEVLLCEETDRDVASLKKEAQRLLKQS